MLLDRDQSRLEHMLRAGEEIERHLDGVSEQQFMEQRLLQIMAIHNLQIIGEAACRLSDALRSQHQHVPWTQIIGMRHRIVHDYEHVDLVIVWQTVRRFLPSLTNAVRAILAEEKKISG